MALLIEIFRCLNDNYGYLLHDEATKITAALDAPEAATIDAALIRRGWNLTDIFITHHHSDHTGGIADLKSKYGAKVTGPRSEASKIGSLEILVGDGASVWLGETCFEIIETPGHTLGHIVYHDPKGRHLFTADALFSLGCGRMFEGEPGPMWEGLKKLRALPENTKIYCGHEYTLANAKFALSVDPHNMSLKKRATEIIEQHRANTFTIPTTIGAEKAQNPFLRADNAELAARMGVVGSKPADVFAALRKAKDTF